MSTKPSSKPGATTSDRRVLIVKLGAIGDVLMVLPTARALHEAGYEVDWLCGKGVKGLLACYPWINAIEADESALAAGSLAGKLATVFAAWRKLLGRQYLLVATLYFDPRYRALSMSCRADTRVALSASSRETALLPGRSHADEYARIVRSALEGVVESGGNSPLPPVLPAKLPSSPLARTSTRPRVMICPGGAKNLLRDDPLRRWPLRNYVELARMLLCEGHEVVVAGGPGDHWIDSAFEGLRVENTVGTLSVVQSWALMADCDVVVTHDTGPLHMAGATRTPVVALFGPTSPTTFAPRRAGSTALWGGEDLACRPCYDGKNFATCRSNACLQQISPTAVMNQVRSALGIHHDAKTSGYSVIGIRAA